MNAIFLLVLPVLSILAEECTLPSDTILTNLLNNTLIVYEGVEEGLLVNLQIENHSIVCLAAGDALNKYKYLSVVAQYRKNESDAVEYGQYQAECMADEEWVTTGEFQQRDLSFLSVPLREDCFYCTTFTNDNNCIGEY